MLPARRAGRAGTGAGRVTVTVTVTVWRCTTVRVSVRGGAALLLLAADPAAAPPARSRMQASASAASWRGCSRSLASGTIARRAGG